MESTKHVVFINNHPTLVTAEYNTSENCGINNLVIKNQSGVDITSELTPPMIAQVESQAKRRCVESNSELSDDNANYAFLTLDGELPLNNSVDAYRTGKIKFGVVDPSTPLTHMLEVVGSVKIQEATLTSPSKIFVSAGDGVIKVYDFDGIMLKSTYDANGDGVVNSAAKIEGVDAFSSKKYYGTDENGNVGFFDGGADGQDGNDGQDGQDGLPLSLIHI